MAYRKSNEIVKEVNLIAYNKKISNNYKTLTLAFLGGAYIAFGGMLAIIIGGGCPGLSATNPGLQKFIFGAVFPLGLILIAIAGGELFTGNTSYFIPSMLSRKITYRTPLKNWTIVYFGNFIGALFIAYFIAYLTNLLGEQPWKEATIQIAEHKVHSTFFIVLLKGIACNWLVALAMWKSYAAKDILGKIFALWIPVMAFVAMGFEHSIANMFFIPVAMFYGADISIYQFIFDNLIPATIGNIIGGAFFVGCLYWFVYDRD